MITEDYVSRETYKLLKEKGYDGEFKTCYDIEGYTYTAIHLYDAMKWLREVHHLHITVFSSSQESWMYRITKPHQKLEEGCYGEDYTSNEEACEAAIKYCLEKLI